MMDIHTELFFSEEDLARFTKGRIFLGENLPGDGASKLALATLAGASASMPAHTILPTADQYRRVRERQEHSELHRDGAEGESYVTVGDLPFVCEYDSNAQDGVGCLKLKKQTNPLESLCNNDKSLFLDNTGSECSELDGGHASDGEMGDGVDKSNCDSREKVDKNKKRKTTSAKDMSAKSSHELKKRSNCYDLYSDRSENIGGDSSASELSDELISSSDENENNICDQVKVKNADNGKRIRWCPAEDKSEETNNTIAPGKDDAQVRLHAYKSDPGNNASGGDSREDGQDSNSNIDEEMSDELISSDEEEELLSQAKPDEEEELLSQANPTPVEVSGKCQNKTLINSSEAIGSSIIKSIPDDSGWHNRRSESEVVLTRIRQKQHRSLLKRRRRTIALATVNSPEGDGTNHREGDEAQQPRRTTLRFAAAPVAVKKRKKQMSLKSLFKKKP